MNGAPETRLELLGAITPETDLADEIALLHRLRTAAFWWSFGIRDEVQQQLRPPFNLYLHNGRKGGVVAEYHVIDWRTGRRGIPSPWPIHTEAKLQNRTSLGPRRTDQFRTWFLVDRIVEQHPPISLSEFRSIDSRRVPRPNRNAFSYVERLSAVALHDGSSPAALTDSAEVAAAIDAELRAMSRGQGRRRTQSEIRAIDAHAMRTAKLYLKTHGWDVRDVSKTNPYDLAASRADETLDVEVKGTTTAGEIVTLTHAEVRHARSARGALLIVSQIELSSSGTECKASGGHVRIVEPWKIVDEDLKATVYTYRVPSGTYSPK